MERNDRKYVFMRLRALNDRSDAAFLAGKTKSNGRKQGRKLVSTYHFKTRLSIIVFVIIREDNRRAVFSEIRET